MYCSEGGDVGFQIKKFQIKLEKFIFDLYLYLDLYLTEGGDEVKASKLKLPNIIGNIYIFICILYLIYI